ncbi:MAG: hypothetical protein RLZZ479_339, partial [Bacteroidota bacterium]
MKLKEENAIYSAPALDKGLDILEVLSKSENGLTQQEMKRLNLSTQKILRLELDKVKSIRSISFIQGTFVNLMRSSILFLLLY